MLLRNFTHIYAKYHLLEIIFSTNWMYQSGAKINSVHVYEAELFDQIVIIFNNKEENLRIYDDPWICHWLCCYIIYPCKLLGKCWFMQPMLKIGAFFGFFDGTHRCRFIRPWRSFSLKGCLCCCYHWCTNVGFCNQGGNGWRVLMVG